MNKEEKLPAVVGVYGASFDTGSGIEMKAYEGSRLAKDGNLVYVIRIMSSTRMFILYVNPFSS